MDSVVEWSAREAERRLRPLGRRILHVKRVAERAGEIGTATVGAATRTLTAAAYLHDVGYAPELATTGFHPLDVMTRHVGRDRVTTRSDVVDG